MRNKLTIILMVAIGVAFVAGCRRQVANQTVANTNTASAEAPIGGTATRGEKFYFRGTIGGNLSIEMTLVRDEEKLTGSYFYPKLGKNITLAGTVDAKGNVDLTETDENGKSTGTFKGTWKPAEDSPDPALEQISGKWSKPDGSKQTDFQVVQQPIRFTAAVRISPKVIKENNKEKKYTVDAEYPQIEGDSRFDSFNREARNLITKDVNSFKTAESDQEAQATTDLPEETQTSTIDVGYEIRHAADDLISVEFSEGTYSRGAAHPNTGTTVLNYDVKNNRKLALADLFTPKSNYLNVISQYCIKEFKSRQQKDKDSMLDDEMMKSGAAPSAENYEAWAITRTGLWITFDPYQVAPYAAGPQYVLVPYSALKEIIKPDGPLANFSR
jgi:hypothetical protein